MMDSVHVRIFIFNARRRQISPRNRPSPAVAVLPILFVLAMSPGPVFSEAVEDGHMLLHEISGNRYERKTFNADGDLTGRDVIQVGGARASEETFRLPIDITVYNTNGEVERRFTSQWTCRQGGEQMVMPILFIAETKRSPMRLVITGDPVVYPRNPKSRLEDLELTIKSAKGILSLLPGRSIVKITDRHLVDEGSMAKGRYTIEEKIELKVVVLGIPFKRIERNSVETVDPEQGLLRQVLEAPDGSRSVIRLLPDRDAQRTSTGGPAHL